MIRTWKTLIAFALCMGIATVGSPAGARAPTTNGRIVFSRTDPFGNSLDYTANPDGSHERLLFPGQAEWAHWSPNGNEIAVRHADDLAATIVDPDTGATRDLPIPDPVFACTPTTTLEECENTDFSCPSWSPDGARLACSAISGVDPSRDGVYTIRSSDGGDLTLIKSCPPACGFVGDFSPDGKRLSFVGLDAERPTAHLRDQAQRQRAKTPHTARHEPERRVRC